MTAAPLEEIAGSGSYPGKHGGHPSAERDPAGQENQEGDDPEGGSGQREHRPDADGRGNGSSQQWAGPKAK